MGIAVLVLAAAFSQAVSSNGAGPLGGFPDEVDGHLPPPCRVGTLIVNIPAGDPDDALLVRWELDPGTDVGHGAPWTAELQISMSLAPIQDDAQFLAGTVVTMTCPGDELTGEYLFTGLAAATTHHFSMRVKDPDPSGGPGEWGAIYLPCVQQTTVADQVAPGVVGVTVIAGAMSANAQITWPCENGASGGAVTSAILKISHLPYTSQALFDSLSHSVQAIQFDSPGDPQTITAFSLGGLSPLTTYYVAVQATDNANLASPLPAGGGLVFTTLEHIPSESTGSESCLASGLTIGMLLAALALVPFLGIRRLP